MSRRARLYKSCDSGRGAEEGYGRLCRRYGVLSRDKNMYAGFTEL